MTFPRNHSSYLWLLAVLLLLIVFGWRILATSHLYMRDDEEIAFRTTSGTLVETIDYQANQDIQAPLWFALFWGWQQIAGSTEFAARVFSVLWAMIAIALMYRLASRWFKDIHYGLFTIIVLAVNAYFFIYSVEIRPYPLIMVCAATSMLLFGRWLDKPTWRRAFIYGASVALMMYVHYLLAFLIVVQIIYVVFRGQWRARLPQFGAALGFAFILWLPWLPAFIHQIQVLRELAEAAGQVYGIGVGTTSTAEPRNWETVQRLIQVGTNGQPFLYLVIWIVGIFYLYRKPRYWLATLWAFGVPILALTANLIVAIYAQRYVSYLSLGLALVIGAAIAALPRFRWIALTGFIALNLLTFTSHLPVRTPLRDIFTAISLNSQPGDVVVFEQAELADNLVRWHVNEYLEPSLQRIEDRDNFNPSAARRIWYITANLLNEDIQQSFHEIEVTHPVQQVLGDCTRSWCYVAQLMEAPPSDTAAVFGGVMPFYGADVDAVTPDAVNLRLWWRTDETIPLDYSVGIHLLNQDGLLIAQTDGPIQHYGTETIQTSAMEPGKIYMDVRTLALPENLPAGDYSLNLIVYQPWDGARLTKEDGSDILQIDRITLP